MFKKRKQKIISNDPSTIEYWEFKIKTGMKLNNSNLHNIGKLRYSNFIVPDVFVIIKRQKGEIMKTLQSKIDRLTIE